MHSKISEDSTPQYSVCLNLDYERLQGWLNRTVHNVNYGAPSNIGQEIITCVSDGTARPASGGVEPDALDPVGSAPFSEHGILPNDGGDDPTIPSDLSPTEVNEILLNAMHAQEVVNVASETALLEREAMDVDDAATSVAPTEAVNPGY